MPGLNDPSCAYEIFVGKYATIYDKVFHSEKWKRNSSIFVSLGLLKVLLNP